ncbi:MAG: hypothetical protein N5P05_001193 [Chroococcopsis gigantea SAG 12.99]|jgi:molybdopterin/thiamine biosynthesis adenylyltransferase|nr:ThiF family adenylyltransferase [Chlorogloea purpurea SAG 13.99]MDV2999587.1 hypothetical protein [Chroococcopsis gigantea SAG 12.99]
MSIYFHEGLYRTPQIMAKLKDYRVTVCGAGALGANLTENLARGGFGKLKVIDRDRIEERNLSTQPYYRSDVGAFKAQILANNLYRALGTPVEAQKANLDRDNVSKLLKDSQLVIDVFDNSVSRRVVKEYTQRAGIPCLHAGLSPDYAEVIWNESYRVPTHVNDDVCDYPLARNLVMLTVAVASEAIVSFIATGEQRNFTITLKDLRIESL